MRYFLFTTFLFILSFTQAANINYKLTMSEPHTHYYEVHMTITDYEKDYLLDMIIQELEDDDECVGTLHKETLQSIYDKLIQIK